MPLPLPYCQGDGQAGGRVLVGMQHTNNYRFDCEFVLKYYSN